MILICKARVFSTDFAIIGIGPGNVQHIRADSLQNPEGKFESEKLVIGLI